MNNPNQDTVGADGRHRPQGEALRARPLAIASPTERKNAALFAMADAIDPQPSRPSSTPMRSTSPMAWRPALSRRHPMDRLKLTPERIAAMAEGVREIAALADPVGEVIAAWERPNGLQIERVRTPLGVIGVIYESRPNVTADAGALCLKAGNPVILRGGSDSINSSSAIHACLAEGLKAAGLPEDAIQLVPTTDRAAVGEMLAGLGGNLDVIIPRGGKSLVARVQNEARVPVFAHLEGICHLYIDKSADLEMAVSIAVNAKMRRTGICGAAETLLVDRAVAATHLVPILEALEKAGCEIRGSDEVRAAFPKANACDGRGLAHRISRRDHLGKTGRRRRRGDRAHRDLFLAPYRGRRRRRRRRRRRTLLQTRSIPPSSLHNASTQFADGGEFGMGAEIGIATGKMHARGPVGVEQLTSFKYRVRGTGQLRP
jgi:glutamate-5-semialdehyde dehydrogenase